jgi:flagellar motility protein MotE (MotC chaperone)/sporulation protein YlmC with PRC-barrel domain
VLVSTPPRVFAARLSGLPVFDPLGDQVGKVRDVVMVLRGERLRPMANGLVVEVPGRKRVFLPMTRVTSLESGQVITTGLLNLRRFEKRGNETLVVGEVLERTVDLLDGSGEATVEDVALEADRKRDWTVAKVFVRRGAHRGGLSGRLRRRGETLLLDVDQVTGLAGSTAAQGATMLVAAFEEMKAADIADVLHDLSDKRRVELAAELDDERLADVLEELPEDEQVEILQTLGRDRAADVLEAMQPDDAADLLGELSQEQQEHLLEAMEQDEADDVRRLLAYDEDTAGGLMTSEPVVLGPESSVAEALALVRRSELSPALAAAVFVCRPPTETPTGTFLGVVHIQRMLREPPHVAIGAIIDKDIEPVPADAPLELVTRRLATYNLVSVPVTDADDRLIGAVTVDDVPDHLLPEDWRDHDDDEVHPVPEVG